MTLILGLEDPDNDRAIVAFDSGVWSGDLIDTLRSPKAWRRGPYIIGAAGSLGIIQRIRALEVPRPVSESPTWEQVEECVSAFAVLIEEETGASAERARRVEPDVKIQYPEAVVAFGRWVWNIEGGAVVSPERGAVYVGALDYAAGAVAAASATFTDRLRVADIACHAVESVTAAVRGPWRWLSTDGSAGEF